MEIKVPNLVSEVALSFCAELEKINELEGETYYVDFANLHTCDPFPMLIVANSIRHKRERLKHCLFYAKNVSHSYAKHMKFFRACGLGIGEPVEYSRGNSNYSCITKLSVKDLREEGWENCDVVQEVIEKKAKEMAKIVAQGNEGFQKWLAYTIRELIRNIPEHSNSDTIWYCAQYWPSYDLVELAIMDEGIGIRDSLCENYNHVSRIKCDADAVKLALEPGISGARSASSFSQNEWDNSGYGLYVVSEMCAELDASFIIASGDTAIRVKKENGEIKHKKISTCIHGTALQIRVRPSECVDYGEIMRKIVAQGEKIAKQNRFAVHVASKSSRGI